MLTENMHTVVRQSEKGACSKESKQEWLKEAILAQYTKIKQAAAKEQTAPQTVVLHLPQQRSRS